MAWEVKVETKEHKKLSFGDFLCFPIYSSTIILLGGGTSSFSSLEQSVAAFSFYVYLGDL